MRWKVCGMRESSNIQEVADFRPDFMGFIWAEASPRYVGEDFRIPLELLGDTIPVGVFVNRSVSSILKLSESAGFTWVQLHGEETEEEMLELKNAGIKVVKAVSVAEERDLKNLSDLPDYYLFDTKKGSQTGGTGERFDWQILAAYQLGKPFFLAGGLSFTNLEEALTLSKSFPIYALDFNSKIELNPGLKDIIEVQKISKRLVEN
ncbi:phosphoribosylanthranilate isomerase [Aquirufa rosea]|uniref:phosphoribosylanthranilate isomerase n=1 Tax=Aquirufa rosea TaxID=2509241 RepID=UPI00197AB885|nr:phosphoribosylanthranilate isomerase [Aquirufa rosea]